MWLMIRWSRRRWPAMVPIALLMALGSTGMMVALAASQRTAGAYDGYLPLRRRASKR